MATTGLESLVDQTISVITNDGRNIVGVLKGFDQATNLILDESHERVYSTKVGVEPIVLGLYIIRGDNIAVVGFSGFSGLTANGHSLAFNLNLSPTKGYNFTSTDIMTPDVDWETSKCSNGSPFYNASGREYLYGKL
ncbi:hypothetical protein GOP47_0005354 [Adiantum capillus-veneris]|uniref:U6 snRNA-associated Sm-like protein LSm8 n=1 Tax=Adiantum capillus-veneris TaxID=13818 RepID=A0A9D4V4Y0_ADICA|nr:hypothetical protein GOP47_0005354 [Adiantum capillus-veneris]